MEQMTTRGGLYVPNEVASVLNAMAQAHPENPLYQEQANKSIEMQAEEYMLAKSIGRMIGTLTKTDGSEEKRQSVVEAVKRMFLDFADRGFEVPIISKGISTLCKTPSEMADMGPDFADILESYSGEDQEPLPCSLMEDAKPDTVYMLDLLVKVTMAVLAAKVDTGYISDQAVANMTAVFA